MSLIFQLPRILEESKTEYEKIKAAASVKSPFAAIERHCACVPPGSTLAGMADSVLSGDIPAGMADSILSGNILARGDNLDFMKYLLDEQDMAGKLQLVYMDPPFYSNASYDAVIKLKSPHIEEMPAIKPEAYDDHWKTGMEDYLSMLCVRFYLIRDLLSDEGCFWIHLDWHVVHYVKILMDEIFGADNFVNEVIWNYKSGGTGKRSFSRKHDTLLFYSKSKNYYFNPLQEKSYNRGFKPYRFKGVEEFQDELGWYTMVNMKDVWQLDMVGRTSSERTGYATQKPETLLSRIIESCSREGDLCADFFSGSGTLAAAAEKLGRRWIACDIGGIATASCLKRLSAKNSSFTVLEQMTDSVTGSDDLSIELSAEPAGDTGKQLITITLSGYRLDIRHVPVQGEDRETIKKFRRKDPLQLLECWSVDFSYDGSVHKPQYVFTKEINGIQKTCSHMIEAACDTACSSADTGAGCNTDIPHRISIRAVDIFGNSTLKVMEV